MKSVLNWSQNLSRSKVALLAVSLGLAFGFAGGLMLHSNAETSAKLEAKPESSTVRVHSGTTEKNKNSAEPETALNRLRYPAWSFFLPLAMMEPWWSPMQFDSDASLMLKNFDSLSSRLDHGWDLAAGAGAYMPRLDTIEQSNEIKVTAEVPGIDAKNLDVTVNDDAITIKGERKNEETQARSDKASIVERSYGAFQRTISLPCRVESEKANATLKNGILVITVPKSRLAHAEGSKPTIKQE